MGKTKFSINVLFSRKIFENPFFLMIAPAIITVLFLVIMALIGGKYDTLAFQYVLF